MADDPTVPELDPAVLELELAATVSHLLDLFERCEAAQVPAMPIILQGLQARGVELPAGIETFIEMMG